MQNATDNLIKSIRVTPMRQSMRKQFVLDSLLVVMVLLCGARLAMAQGGTASAQLNGTITDPTGAAIPRAMISVRNTATNTTNTAISSDRGFYAVANLAPGTYE